MTDIKQWLESQDLGDFVELFQTERVDLETLPDLNEQDLKDIGIPLGPRKKLIKLIDELSNDSNKSASLGPSEAERRHLTVMFCDLVGSTALSSSHDPEDTREVIIDFQNTCVDVINRLEGFIAKFMGDGVLAYFGYPLAHEDEAERAVRSGLALTEAIAKLKAPNGEPLAARIGIATGLVVVGDMIGDGATQERAIVGDAPNLAARLQGIAGPGQVVISEKTRRLLGNEFDFDDLGKHELKGIGGAVQAILVLDERSVESKFEATRDSRMPMLGRDQELALLQERWKLTKAGEGQGVLLVGEAGIGKSRISRSLLDSVANEPHTLIQYQCSPYHLDSALWPVIQQLHRAIELVDDESSDTSLDTIEQLVQHTTGDVDTVTPLIASLLGIDDSEHSSDLELSPQVRRSSTLEALVQHLLGFAQRQPTIVILEDVHWIDPTTFEFIEQCLDRISNARILLLMTSRPEKQPEFTALPHITTLTLNRLGRSRVEAIIARLGGNSLPAPTIDAIIERTDGVPLFVEEMTKAVMETGLTNIPETLHDSLMARLDRIPEIKEIAQIAATIGREFEFSLLASVATHSEDELTSLLDKLVAADLVFRQGTPPNTKYTFKHALVQDAAYNSQLKRNRQELHSKIAQAIEDSSQNIKVNEPEVLAHHYTEAGQLNDALPLWQDAGKLALSNMALVESISHLNHGLEVIKKLPPSAENQLKELHISSLLGTAWMALEGWTTAGVWDNFQRALELAKSLERHEELVPIYYGLWSSVLTKGRFANAMDWVREILDSAQASGDSDLSIMGHAVACTTHFWRGEFEQCDEHGQQVIAEYNSQNHGHLADIMNVDPKTYASVYVSLGLWIRGYPDQAMEIGLAKDEHARQHGHPFDIAYALTIGCQLWDFRHEPERLLSSAKEAKEVGKTNNLPFVSDVLAPIFEGIGKLREGQLNKGLELLQDGTEKWTVGGAGGMTPYLRSKLAEGLILNGNLSVAMELVEQSLIQSFEPECEERAHLAEVLRLKALILRQQGEDLLAEESLLESLDIARAQQAKSWELRTSITLAELWQSRGKQKQALELLLPQFKWFTEGLDTHDLITAKSLLDELS